MYRSYMLKSTHIYCILYWYISFIRVKSIKFYFGLHTFLRDHVLESKTRATVHAKFCISITLKNDQYSSMTVEVDMGEPNFRRYCTEFREMTILDIVIIVLLILSSIAHCASFIRTYKLAKVQQLLIVFTCTYNWKAPHVYTCVKIKL